MEATYVASAIISSLITGAIIGAIPAICGAIKGKINLSIIGFFACLLSAFVLGMILAIPVCAVFVWLIFKKDNTSDKNTSNQVSHTTEKSDDELVRFKNLYEQGVITQEEFEAKKKQILGL